jgi:hypothetical protein
VILVFFSLPASKLAGYVLPVVPALAGGLAWWAVRLLPAGSSLAWPGEALPRWWSRAAIGAAVFCLALIATVLRFDNRAAHSLAPRIAQAMQGDAQLLYVESYAYDLPYLLGLTQPLPLFTHWDDPELPKHDNDLKELFDAAAFNPQLGKRLLQPRSAFTQALCSHARTVVVGPPDAPNFYGQLAVIPPVQKAAKWQLWVLEREVLREHGLACTPLAERGLAAL